ncbi:MAG: inorganic pyrophosphatase [Acidimicrobiia bacterium]|nr:inorganic pyrophosphatase [Acidimicrobiia bacterium]
MHDFREWRPHPWHGLEVGPQPPTLVTAYIEITPFDLVKYEVDKPTGYLKVDRPQQGASSPPTLYGFIPSTYCGPRVAMLSPGATEADGDPLDICVVSERPITRADIILTARVVGGLRMIDDDEADDKIIGVLAGDPVWGGATDLDDLPVALVNRLEHYFVTYKNMPGAPLRARVEARYDMAHAGTVIEAAIADYDELFRPA